MNALIRLNSAVIVGCLRVIFGCIEQSFPEGVIKPYEGTILTTGKVCCVQYLLVFRLVSGYRGDLGPETERLDIARFVVGNNKSLASKSGFYG